MKTSMRRLATALAALCLGIGAALGLVAAPAQAAGSGTTEQTFLTFYGWWDNTPPGGVISYPRIHQTAGGTGTYSDPITFATDSSEQPPGTIVYVPRVGKYFIMEDSCGECTSDWTGHGPNGGPGLRHLDLWLGGEGGSAFAAIECEDALTNYNNDGTPTMESVIVNPPSNESVTSEPIFNTGTGACYGGAKPTITVGQYKNVSTGKCMTDPNDSSTAGALLVTAACDSTAASQRFTFDGTFLQINKLCADYSTSQISMQKCTAGPSQQWSYNTDLTFTDIQSGKKYINDSSGKVKAGSSSSSTKTWTFVPASTTANDFAVSAGPASASVTAGGTATTTISTSVTAGSAESVALSATGGPAGSTITFTPASVTAGGTSTLSVATSSSTAAGTYTVTVTGTAASGTHTATYTLTVTPTSTGGCTAAQLLVNPGFESGTDSGWTGKSTLGFNPITNSTSGEPPHSGSWEAWFNGNGSADTDTVSQPVTIPSGCTATVSYWLHVDSTENTSTAKPDTFTVQLLNASGTVLATLAGYSNLDNGSGYTQHSDDVSAYAGQSVTLRFTGTETDKNGGTTSFVLDDTALNTK
ncbi:ricin-type beta-trefoil lectin domain protein [Catenulispora sp. NF23]|uniref:RICIN domain-containing protein n=1 Tax=Catenulispora pinistramenti TaxID=2705254 RepID=UPI001BAAD868|nr:RICIN domain-containing protein [Catenulispora pinistramenti]MBS2531411.1 ricin-type beta-trefoil lectin domain protein [Catenulispora pinistramenti]